MRSFKKPMFEKSVFYCTLYYIYHAGHFWINGFCDYTFVVCDEVNNFIKRCSLDFFVLEITKRIHSKIKQNTALLNLLEEKLFSFIWCCV